MNGGFDNKALLAGGVFSVVELIVILCAVIAIVVSVIVILDRDKKKKKRELLLKKEEIRNKPGKKATLFVKKSDGERIQLPISVDKSTVVGRADISDVVIEDVGVSRQHFILSWDGESFYVQDLETKNGTSLNGVKLTHTRRLENGDVISIGKLEITVRW